MSEFSFKSALDDFLKEQNLESDYQQRQLVLSWQKIMGRPIAARTRRISFKDHIMFVELTSPALKDELNRSKETVLSRIREVFTEAPIEDVRFI